MKRYFCAGFLVLAAALLVLSTAGSAPAAPIGTCLVQAPGGVLPATTLTSCTAAGEYTTTAAGLTLNPGVIITAIGPLQITVTGDMDMEPGSGIDADNTTGGGHCPRGWPVKLNVKGDFNMDPPTVPGGPDKPFITSNACSGGDIEIITLNAPAGLSGIIHIDGLVESVGSVTGAGGTQPPGGGPITIIAKCDLTISDDGVVSSKGKDPGADLVTLRAGCKLLIDGLVESTGKGHAIPNSPANHCQVNGHVTPATACVQLISGDALVINGVFSCPGNGGHRGEVNADISAPGVTTPWIDIFNVRGGIKIIDDGVGPFVVHADNRGGTDRTGGDITVTSSTSFVFATGNAISASTAGAGGHGGMIDVNAKLDVNLRGASVNPLTPPNNVCAIDGQFVATGSTAGGGHRGGGAIAIKSWGTGTSGSVLGASASELDVTGGTLASSTLGTVSLTACGTNNPSGAINNAAMQAGTAAPAGIDFPPGVVTPVLPVKSFGICGGTPPIPPGGNAALQTVLLPEPPALAGGGVIGLLPDLPAICPCVNVCNCVKAGTLTKNATTLSFGAGVLDAQGLALLQSPGLSVVYGPTCDPVGVATTFTPTVAGTSATATPAPNGTPAQAKVILIIPGCNASLCVTAP